MPPWPYDRRGRRIRRPRIRWGMVTDNWAFFFLGGCLTVLAVYWLREVFGRWW